MTEVLLGTVTVRRRLPESVGGGIVIANARAGGLRYLFTPTEQLDSVLFKVAKSLVRQDDIVWDIGGNVGLFAVSAAGLSGSGGSVYTIEPDKDTFALLLRTAKAQPSDHAPITCLNAAVSNKCGIVQFNIARRSRSTNFIAGFGSTQAGGVAETRPLVSLTLDVLLEAFPSPNVLKIDVEGAELSVLCGARSLLSNVRPAIFVEVCAETAQQVGELLRAYEYRILNGTSLLEVGEGESVPWDTVAIPMEADIDLTQNATCG